VKKRECLTFAEIDQCAYPNLRSTVAQERIPKTLWRRRNLLLPSLLLVLNLLPVLASAQDISGKLVGQITDSSGAAVVKADVTVMNPATGFTKTTQSNDQGEYMFESLPAGSYTVTCKAADFATVVSRNNVVQARETVTLPLQLKVASATTQVEVASSATMVDTTTSEVQDTLSSDQLLALPVEGRDPSLAVALTLPGVVQGNNNNAGIPLVRVNGGRGGTNNYQVDGTENLDFFNGGAATFPPVEDLAEISTVTNAGDPQYGTSSGSQMTAIVKSGTDHLHGEAWSYIQNSGLNANTWAGKASGQPRPTGAQHWYGGNVGGPVFLPKVYDGRKRTFFFVAYEYTNPSEQVLQQQRVLTNAERAGDFSNSSFGVPIINGVATPTLNPSAYSSMAKTLLANTSLLPTTSDPNGNYSWLGNSADKKTTTMVKVDQVFSDKHRIFLTFYRYHDDLVENPLLGISFGYPVLPTGDTADFITHFQNWTINDTYTLNQHMVNTFMLGVRPFTNGPQETNENKNLTWSSIGVPGIVPDSGASDAEVGLFVNGYFYASSCCNGFGLYGNWNDATNLRQYDITDNLSWQIGRHMFRTGYYERVLHMGKRQDWDAAGIIDFEPTNVGSTGNPFADFLLGQGAAFHQQSALSLQMHYPAREAYAQDEWQVTRRLTTTFGVRFAPNFGLTENQKELSAFRPGIQSTTFPYAPVGLVVPGDPGVPNATYPTSWANFAPRVSFAYNINRKSTMVLHAGYGINYDYLYFLGFNAFGSAVPYGFAYNSVAAANLNNIYNGPSPFPYVKPLPGTASTTNYHFPNSPLTVYSSAPNFNSGRTQQYNVGLEWQPFGGYLISAAYVGTRGTGLATSSDLNTPSVSPTATNDAANVQSRRPYQQFQNIFQTFSGSESWYNSMQISLNKHLTQNFSLLANYTLSRDTDDGDAVGSFFSSGTYRDPHDPKLDYGVSKFDTPQAFSLLYLWRLPLLNRSSWIARETLGGWSWSGHVQALSGDALTITSPATFNYASSNGAWANYVGGSVYGSRSNRTSEAAAWLNKSAFCPANEFGSGCTVVDSSAGLTHLDLGNFMRGSVRGPGKLFNDMTLTKGFPLREPLGRLQFDVSAFNVFNHTVLQDPDNGIADGTFGKISQAYPNRVLQLVVHYVF
jgi:hypothetical protein